MAEGEAINYSNKINDSNENDNGYPVLNDECVLEESDISGATLTKPVEQCNMAVLKRWLLCRGAKISGKKNDLVRRVKDYVQNGLAEYLVDPDGGVNLARKKLKLCILPAVDCTTDENFPSSGFTADLDILPTFTHNSLWKFMIEDVEQQKQLSTEKPLVKGFNLFKSGHVLQVYVKEENEVFFVQSKVLPSMKKGKIYTAKIALNREGIVLKANCGCPAGVDGRCNHVTASLFALESFSSSKSNHENSNTPCTSKPCKWNVPRQKKIEPSPVRHMQFVKHEWNKEKKHKYPIKGNDVRAPHERTITKERLEEVQKMVAELQRETGKVIGLSLILPQQVPVQQCPTSPPRPEGEVPSRDPIETDAQKFAVCTPPCPELPGPLSLDDIKEKSKRAKRRLFAISQQREEVAIKTKDQHQSPLWYIVRQPRITASKAKRCLLKDTTSPTKAVSAVLQYNGVIQTRFMREGIEWEGKIIERYEYASGNKVVKSGFVISAQHPFLGASPDGMIHNGAGVIEVKKVSSKEGESYDDTLRRIHIYKKKEGGISINRVHSYYVQMQQQMYCTGCLYCHFIVANGTWMHIDVIAFDKTFWDGVLTKLEKFYFNYVFPEIVYPQILHGSPRWGKEITFPFDL